MARASTNSDVEIIEDEKLGMQQPRTMPHISSVNVTKSTKVHIGPKIVTVNQTVENAEKVKTHIFGLELVSTKRLRCSVAIFLCWAFLVAACLTIYLVYFVLYKQQVRLDIGLNASWYLRRGEWQAMRTYGEEYLHLPVQYVVIGHSASSYCNDKYACMKSMLAIQNDHFKRGYDDIGPNFLVGGNGTVFEGRGANIIGAMAKYWNLRSITVMFIGDYTKSSTEPKQLEHLNILLDTLVNKSIIRPDFIVFAHCQVSPDTYSPGIKLVRHLKDVTHWNSTNENRCLVS